MKMPGDHSSWLPLKLTVLILAAFLAACSAQGTETANQTEAMTGIPHILTPTLPSTEAPTPSIPTIEVDGLQAPDPHVSNPELFDLANPESPIVQFANAFGANPEDVAFGAPELKTAADGTQFIVLTTSDLPSTTNYDETGIPLLWSCPIFVDTINVHDSAQTP